MHFGTTQGEYSVVKFCLYLRSALYFMHVCPLYFCRLLADYRPFRSGHVADVMMNCESVEDEFELFRAQSYGVESVLRHQRAASVRASAKVKVVIPSPGETDNKVKITAGAQDDLEKHSPEVTPQPRSAAERKASFKSSARRRIYHQRIPEEVIVGDDQTTYGACNKDGDGGEAVVRPLPGANGSRLFAADDSELGRQRGGDVDVDDDVIETSQDICRVYRMRSFYTKSGNIVNRGDSMRLRTPTSGSARRARDVHGPLPSSTGSSIHHPARDRASAKQCKSADNSAPNTTACRDPSRDHLTVDRISTSGPAPNQRSNESTEDVAASAYRVLVLGSHGVGKTTLTEQLMTSEYLANKESFAGRKLHISQHHVTKSTVLQNSVRLNPFIGTCM